MLHSHIAASKAITRSEVALRLDIAAHLNFQQCEFINNAAELNGGAIIGGPGIVTDCVFTENSAGDGGALSISRGTIERCEFVANTAETLGGAIRATVTQGPLTLNECVLSGNTTGARGGAIYTTSFNDGVVTITGSKFKNNTADTQGGAIYVSPTGDDSDAVIADTLFCSNLPEHIAGPWLDNGGNEFHDTCSVSADITGDGLVNVDDLLAVIASWGPCPAGPDECPADIAPASTNGDGMVNVDDLLAVLANWGG